MSGLRIKLLGLKFNILSYHPVIKRLPLFANHYCTSETNSEHRWRKPWAEREGEWYSSLQMFAPKKGGSLDTVRFLQQDIDLRPSKIKSWWKNKQEQNELLDQRYIPERHQILGNDLATAHFIVHRGGAVRFVGSPHWLQRNEEEEYDLPKKYVPDVFLDAVDASNMVLHYEGLANIVSLRKLKLLKLSGGKHIDDWCLDRISCEHAETVEVLDLSHCPKITHRGLSILTRMRKLRELRLEGITMNLDVRLICLLLEEHNSNLTIHGIDHSQQNSCQQR